MFQRILTKAKNATTSFSLKHAAECPSCGHTVRPTREKNPDTDSLQVSCPNCGHSTSAEQWIRQNRDLSRPLVIRPAGCQITYEHLQGSHTWVVPGSGRPNFFWLFSLFWLGISLPLFCAAIYGLFITNNPTQDVIENPWLKWIIFPFMIPFLAIGFGTLYFALASTFLRTTISINSREISIVKNLFGWKRRQRCPCHSITDVSLKTFYTLGSDSIDHESVYSLHFKREDGKPYKIHLTRPHPEKRWLLHEIIRVMGRQSSSASLNGTSSSATVTTSFQSK